jgi:hypothetical protein
MCPSRTTTSDPATSEQSPAQCNASRRCVRAVRSNGRAWREVEVRNYQTAAATLLEGAHKQKGDKRQRPGGAQEGIKRSERPQQRASSQRPETGSVRISRSGLHGAYCSQRG